MNELTEFHLQLIADTQVNADALGLVTVEAFFEKTGEFLSEAGEIESANRAYHESSYLRSTVQIDGYGGDPRENDGILSLILCDFSLDREIRTLHKDHVQRLSQRIFRFLTASLDDEFRERLEETSSGFGIADLIKATWNSVEKIKCQHRLKIDPLFHLFIG